MHTIRPWNNLPPRRRFFDAQTNIRRSVGTVFSVEVFAHLTFLCATRRGRLSIAMKDIGRKDPHLQS